MAEGKQLRIRLVRGLARKRAGQKLAVRALGLRKPNQQVIRDDTPAIRGQIAKAAHLLKVEEA